MAAYGQTDVYVVDNKIDPGGTTGWHTHPGPSLILVVSGQVTNYTTEDRNCAGHTYTAGKASSTAAETTSTRCATPARPKPRRSPCSSSPTAHLGRSTRREPNALSRVTPPFG